MQPNRIYEGAFASPNPRASVLAGTGQLRAADPDGLAVGRFGWADKSTGRAANERTNARQQLGFVLPVIAGWQRIYPLRGQIYIRPGLEVTLMAKGDFWARFPAGALSGDRVYASLIDGTVLSGQPADPDTAEPTSWYVVTSCAAGQLSIISTWSYPP